MKRNSIKTILLPLIALAAGCTGNYTAINSSPYDVTKKQLEADGYDIGTYIQALANSIVSNTVNTAQFTDVLLGGHLSGYYAPSQDGWPGTIANYNPSNDWFKPLLVDGEIIPTLFTNLDQLEKSTDNPVMLAIAKVLKVAAMHRVTDTYGPIPYTKIGVGGSLNAPYDPQELVYGTMFDELDEAIETLTENRTGGISSSADRIYGGSAERWCRFANSLKLRLAMRIVYAAPATAKIMAESAVNHEIGVIVSNADIAKTTTFGTPGNPIWVSVKYNTPENCLTGGDTHVAAEIVCYMNGYGDPRRPKYFIESEFPGVPYVGLRHGIRIPSLKETGRKYSGINLAIDSPVFWMNAAEVAFLKAEAAAVFDFEMGDTPKNLYEEGIRLSFEQWGVASGYAAYIADDESKPQIYDDPANLNEYTTPISDITVAWKDDATKPQMQERIITQKWIANWQLGNEAWADYRRTGFPKLIPASATGNMSNGEVDSELGARRMKYPNEEIINNAVNVQEAIDTYFGGRNEMGRPMWWDCNPAIWN